MFKFVLLLVVLLCLNVNVIAFKNKLVSTRLVFKIKNSNDPDAVSEEPKPELFSMNRRVRLGRSKDEDGKSNIWSIEPTMQVVEEDEDEKSGVNKNLFIGGAVIAAAIASLPLFNAFSTLFPDPSDF